jgi:predicted nucleotidyltransferase
MAVIGVVCEYNPFHRGHLYHLEQARAALEEESAVVCVLSGDFVQRGEAAVYDKFARAEAACRSGADLVIELPLPWCLSSAEGFARGAVSLLGALGCTHMSFGSESGALGPLEDLAGTLRDPALPGEIKAELARDPSLSFAAARERAVRARLGDTARLLREPNDILAAEYLKALGELALPLKPLPILRRGAGHDQRAAEGETCSASQLRQRLREGLSVGEQIPPAAAAVFAREREAGRELTDPRLLETALLSRLRMLGPEDFDALPDAEGGLGRRLWRAVQEEAGLGEIQAAAKSKRYALSRLRRMCLCAALGIPAELNRSLPPYARVLALNGRGRGLLRSLDGGSGLPIVTKPAALRERGGRAEQVFELGARAHDLYTLGLPERGRPGEDWRRGPAIAE